MAQVRETRYLCDSCGKQVEAKRDLRRFDIHGHERSGRWRDSLITDLCDPCEEEFLKVITRFVPAEVRDGAEERFRRVA